ncbi:4-hydroxybenzoate polyprenyltransferase [Rhodobacterales bacterium 52_120_T64]|nr:4-hydroxybenzoate polyprenyltransferase [Rhodobacterales bacterium 52_120_T64]
MNSDDHMPELNQDGRVADATLLNWVDRFAPRWSRPYLRLSRADRPAGTWLLLIPCWWGLGLAVAANPAGGTLNDIWIAIGCAVGAFLMRGAGCTWNDISDRKLDAQVTRTKSRPLPSGQVTVKQAAVWLVLQMLTAFGILLTFNTFTILLGIAALIPVMVYPFAKRFTWWPQVFLGVAFNWGTLLAWAAHTGSLGWPPVLLYLSGIAWTLFYDTIYAHQDKDDDALIGVKSTARLFAAATPRYLFVFMALSVSLMALAAILALSSGPVTPLMLGILAAWAFGMHMFWQMRYLDIDNPEICLKLFRSNRDTGLIAAAIIGIAAIL